MQSAVNRIAMVRTRMAAAISSRTQRVGRRLSDALRRIQHACETRLQRSRALSERLGASLDALSPLKVLDRGYAVARNDAGRVLKRTGDLIAAKRFRLRVVDGEVRARTEEPA